MTYRFPRRCPARGRRLPVAAAPEPISDLSHDALALDLGEGWRDTARYVAIWGRWLFWTGSRWERDDRLAHMTQTRDFLRRRAEALVTTSQEPEAAREDRQSLLSAPLIANVASLARSNTELAASGEQWERTHGHGHAGRHCRPAHRRPARRTGL